MRTIAQQLQRQYPDTNRYFGSANLVPLRDDGEDQCIPAAYLHRSAAWLVGVFASAALLLGIVGLYGVVAYSVGQRTREIGLRMAIGAQPGTIYGLILGEAGQLIATGITLGLVGSMGAAMLLGSMLFGVHAWDSPTLMAVVAVLAICAVLASFVPARRAAAVNPVEALRSE